jgi:hypothetical protein
MLMLDELVDDDEEEEVPVFVAREGVAGARYASTRTRMNKLCDGARWARRTTP